MASQNGLHRTKHVRDTPTFDGSPILVIVKILNLFSSARAWRGGTVFPLLYVNLELLESNVESTMDDKASPCLHAVYRL